MIPTDRRRAAANPSVAQRSAAALAALLLLAGCLAERENTISRTARMREIQAAQGLRERQRRELDLLRQTTEDAQGQIHAANARAIASAAELRAVLADLEFRIGQLRKAEQDLQVAQQRGAAIEQELAPLRALEQRLADLDTARKVATEHAAVLGKEVEAAEQALGAQQATLEPRLAKLREQLAAVAAASQAITQAEAAVAAAQAALAPPPPAQPAAAKPDAPKK